MLKAVTVLLAAAAAAAAAPDASAPLPAPFRQTFSCGDLYYRTLHLHEASSSLLVGGMEKVGRVLVNMGPTSGVIVGEDGYIISSAFNFIQNPNSILKTKKWGIGPIPGLSHDVLCI